MPYPTRLAFVAFFAIAIVACGAKELHFDDAAQALDQGQKSFAAGDEADAKATYEFAASSGTPTEQKEALELLLDLGPASWRPRASCRGSLCQTASLRRNLE